MQWPNVVSAVCFLLLYTSRLIYQALLLRSRTKPDSRAEWSELWLVVVPKNALVLATPLFLIYGVAWGVPFVVGWLLFIAGLILRFVALKQLGRLYSLNVEVRSDHELVTTGLYSVVRHPLYVAYVLDTAGIVLLLQRWWLWPVLVLVIVGWMIRIPREERALRRVFGSVYDQYRASIPAVNLLAGVVHWLRRNGQAQRPSELPRSFVYPARLVSDPDGSTLTDKQKAEVDVHLAEYKALSDFQREEKAHFVRIAIYHNTGILVVVTWLNLVQNSTKPDSVVAALRADGYLSALLFALPLINAILIIASAYQVYSFFCVAMHFQHMRVRLCDLLGADVLGYEEKFGPGQARTRRLSQVLDVVAATLWYFIPALLAFAVAFIVPGMVGFPNTISKVVYWMGNVFSVAAIGYLVGLVTFMIRVQGPLARKCD